jgi:hypothetical protein
MTGWKAFVARFLPVLVSEPAFVLSVCSSYKCILSLTVATIQENPEALLLLRQVPGRPLGVRARNKNFCLLPVSVSWMGRGALLHMNFLLLLVFTYVVEAEFYRHE